MAERLGTTMIFVTHDQVEAMTLADRIVVLKSGVVIQVGTPLELYNRPANLFVAGFIGSPRMNFLPGTVERVEGDRADIRLAGGQVLHGSFPEPPIAGRPVTVGVRPENLIPVDEASALISGEVQITEQPGGETCVYVSLPNDDNITVEIKGQAPIEAGDTPPCHRQQPLSCIRRR